MKLRWLPAALLLLALALIVGAGGVYWLARQAEPVYDGELALAGLADAATVTFSKHAVPSVRANSMEDLMFAQGYLEASERMWQMDLMRRIARGRLAEILGEKALGVDRLFRTLGLGRAADRNLAVLSPHGRSLLEAYARGVNAYRAIATRRLPLEYRIAGIEPDAWSAVDSLSIAEYMGYLLSFNAKEELLYLSLAARVGKERALELFPSDEDVPAPTDAYRLPEYFSGAGLVDPYTTLARTLGLPLPGPASNTWVVSGQRTRSGKPLLAGDPHLMPSLPGIWYELEMQAPGYHTAGISLPGLPLIVIGHNETLAWSMNTSMADTQDIYIERIADSGKAVVRPGGRIEAIKESVELIGIKDRPEPHRLRIRSTSHGVILNEVLAEDRPLPMDFVRLEYPELIALRWNIERPDRAFDGIYALNVASTLDDAMQAIELIGHASQNILLAHRNGDIGWKMSGILPQRRGGSGTFPVPGWDGTYGWSGYVAPQRNPGVVNPASGVIISANNRTVPLDYPVHVSRSWMPPYRARRIEQLLNGNTELTARDMRMIQLDRLGLETEPWRKALRELEAEIRASDPDLWSRTGSLLVAWDGNFDEDSHAAALFVRLRQALLEAIYADELGDTLGAFMDMHLYAYGALQETVRTGRSSFWDDIRTPQTETPAHIWLRALRRVADQNNGTLGEMRRLVFPHAFHNVPLLGQFFDAGPFSTGGDNHTVNVVKAAINAPEDPLFIPSYRVVYPAGDWEAVRGTQTLGQSGHRFSAFRSDQLDDWRAGRLHRWSWNGPGSGTGAGALRLLPGARE